MRKHTSYAFHLDRWQRRWTSLTNGKDVKHRPYAQTHRLYFAPRSSATTLDIPNRSWRGGSSNFWWHQMLHPYISSFVTAYVAPLTTTEVAEYTKRTLRRTGAPVHLTFLSPSLFCDDVKHPWYAPTLPDSFAPRSSSTTISFDKRRTALGFGLTTHISPCSSQIGGVNTQRVNDRWGRR